MEKIIQRLKELEKLEYGWYSKSFYTGESVGKPIHKNIIKLCKIEIPKFLSDTNCDIFPDTEGGISIEWFLRVPKGDYSVSLVINKKLKGFFSSFRVDINIGDKADRSGEIKTTLNLSKSESWEWIRKFILNFV